MKWGIGLFVSKTIIENHQGRVWAERNDGPGPKACFLGSSLIVGYRPTILIMPRQSFADSTGNA